MKFIFPFIKTVNDYGCQSIQSNTVASHGYSEVHCNTNRKIGN